MISEEIIKRLTDNYKNEEACGICMQIDLSEEVDGDRLLQSLDRRGFIDDRLVKLAGTYDEEKFDASLPVYMSQTMDFLAHSLLSNDEIEANMKLKHPVSFINYIVKEGDNWNEALEIYVDTYFTKLRVEEENENGPQEPEGPRK